MKKPEEMTIEELRGELRRVGMTDRLIALAAKEMQEAEQRATAAKADPLRAQLFVLKAYGMTTPDLSLNCKGVLFVTLTTREEIERSAA
jgi:hydroxypyruvate isomerase